MRANGAIEGGAAGFSEGDEVIVLRKFDGSVVKVIGHVDGIKSCEQKYYFRLYLNEVLAEYGGEGLYVNDIGLTVIVKGVDTDPVSYGITSESIDLTGLIDTTPVTIRLQKYRGAGDLVRAQYDSLGYGQEIWPTSLFYGFGPYTVYETSMDDHVYDEYYPNPPNGYALARATSNRMLINSTGSEFRYNYILLQTTVGEIKQNAVNVILPEGKIKVFNVNGNAPDFAVIEYKKTHDGVFTKTYILPDSLVWIIDGIYDIYNEIKPNDEPIRYCEEWYSFTQTLTHVFSGKPVPEISEYGDLTWDFSYTHTLVLKFPPDCAIVDDLEEIYNKHIIPRFY